MHPPLLVVPGNHDIPLYDVVRRFLWPLQRYRRFINQDLSPLFADEQIAVLGVSTARSDTWKNGRISTAQIETIRQRLCAIPASVFKVVVTHHPFVPPPNDPHSALVGRAALALEAIESCGVELLLAGHLHVGYAGDVTAQCPAVKRSMLVAQAGTATSTRTRTEPNAYNFVTIDGPALSLAVRAWDGTRFGEHQRSNYRKLAGKWTLQSQQSAAPAP